MGHITIELVEVKLSSVTGLYSVLITRMPTRCWCIFGAKSTKRAKFIWPPKISSPK